MSEKRQLLEVLNLAIGKALSGVHTMTIARVTVVNQKTINVQPVVPRLVNGEAVQLPEFPDVLPIHLHGGDSSETWPIAVGDYAVLFFAERCLDSWFVGRDGEFPPEKRAHDYSDALALVGVFNENSLKDIPEAITRIGNMIHQGNLTQTGNRKLIGDDEVDGDFSVTGNNEANTYSVDGDAGANGTFVSQDGKTITVKHGLITRIL